MDSEPDSPVRMIPVPFALARKDGAIVDANQPFQDLLGAGRTLADIGVNRGQIANADGKMRWTEITVAGGSHRHAFLAVGRSPDSGGTLTVLVLGDESVASAQRELHELARFPLANPAPVLRMDRGGKVVACNPAAETLFGETDLAQVPWGTICPGVDDAFWARVMTEDPPPTVEARIGDDTVRFHHVRADSGEMVTAFGVVTTDFRRAERELDEKASEMAELARFPDMNPGPVIRTDKHGKILLANIAAREVFGGLLVGRNWSDVCPKVDAEAWVRILAADEAVPIEARVEGHDYVFNHRSDQKTDLVFVYGTDVTRQKNAEQALRQTEKMATLGTLAAGVTHELNNPAAATRRAADQLKDKLQDLEKAHLAFNPASQSDEAKAAIDALLTKAREPTAIGAELDTMGRADKEMEFEDWLDDRGVDDPWEVVPDLVAAGLELELLEPLAESVGKTDLGAALSWVAAVFNISSLAATVSEGAGRLSEIVGALKGYSYLGQAPIQEVDLKQGMENTLVILRSKLKYGITVHREYADDMPMVPALGSELNQVWTNIIDNAADAMSEKGEITIRIRADGDHALVEIEDNGPGIPPDVQTRLFDPFFTTKPPGKGMGLGLSTSYSIITEKHGGTLRVESEPGSTRFITRLPLDAKVGNTDQ